MSAIVRPFGDHTSVILQNNSGAAVEIIDIGAAIKSIIVPDRDGVQGDVVLGYDTPEEYLADTERMGATVGRYANRIHNAAFTLDGVEYRLTANEGRNILHGGSGYEHRIFTVESLEDNAVTLCLCDRDGDNGFPGELHISVRYELSEDNKLIIDYTAHSSRDTVLSLTNHAYFNLAGHGSALDHELRINADSYLPVDDEKIPTGEIRPVDGSDFDFRIRRRIDSGWYDHCFVLNSKECAELFDEKSGRKLVITTDMPGVQLYVGGGMKTRTGKYGMIYTKNSAVCLETQQYPDAPNKPRFPSAVLRAGETFHSRTVYAFSQE